MAAALATKRTHLLESAYAENGSIGSDKKAPINHVWTTIIASTHGAPVIHLGR